MYEKKRSLFLGMEAKKKVYTHIPVWVKKS
jgi:hypothetical protein